MFYMPRINTADIKAIECYVYVDPLAKEVVISKTMPNHTGSRLFSCPIEADAHAQRILEGNRYKRIVRV